jgi:hypothetical protein
MANASISRGDPARSASTRPRQGARRDVKTARPRPPSRRCQHPSVAGSSTLPFPTHMPPS